MRRLAAELDVRCVASTLRGDDLVILEVTGRDRPFRVSLQPGHRAPCVPPIGTVFMAWAGDRAIERWLARAGDELTAEARAWYLEALAAVRRRGCSLSLDGSARARLEQAMVGARTLHDAVLDLGQEAYLLDDLGPDRTYALSHVAVPVFGPDGRVVLALTVYDLPDSLPAAAVEALVARARAAAAAVTEAVGGAPPAEQEDAR
jgi:DNA-binding IclR family transcriptional regulator